MVFLFIFFQLPTKKGEGKIFAVSVKIVGLFFFVMVL